MKRLFDPSNRLFVLARQARRLPPLWAAVILSFLFILGAGILGGIPAFVFGAIVGSLPIQDPVLKQALQQFILLFFSFAPIFFLIWIWVSLYEKRPFWTLGLETRGAATKYVRGFLVGIFLFSLVVGVIGVLGDVVAQPSPYPIQGLPALVGIVIMGLGWLIQGPAEELLCRGWLMPVIGVRYRPWLGVGLSAIIFAIYHSLNPNLNPLAVINLILFGLFMAMYVLFDESLWGVFGLHSAWNWAQGNIFGLPVSGMDTGGGSLVNLRFHGPTWFTGGAFGPEAGVPVTVLLVICILVTGSLLYNRTRPVSTESDLPV